MIQLRTHRHRKMAWAIMVASTGASCFVVGSALVSWRGAEYAALTSAAAKSTQPSSSDVQAAPDARPAELLDRIRRLSGELNDALGTAANVTLGASQHAGGVSESGTVTLDLALVTRLRESSVAALMGHEFAHLALKKGGSAGVGHSRAAKQAAKLEEEADELAGWAVGALGYASDGFAELLVQIRDTAWDEPLARSHYPHDRRITAFMRGYERGRRRNRSMPPESGGAIAGIDVRPSAGAE